MHGINGSKPFKMNFHFSTDLINQALPNIQTNTYITVIPDDLG